MTEKKTTLSSNDIRSQFLTYFLERGHESRAKQFIGSHE